MWIRYTFPDVRGEMWNEADSFLRHLGIRWIPSREGRFAMVSTTERLAPWRPEGWLTS